VGKGCVGRLFVVDAAAQGLVSFSEGLNSGEDVGVGGQGLGGAELGDGEGERGHELLVRVDDVRRKIYIEERSVGRQRAWVFVFVAVRGEKVRAIRRAIDGDFAAGSAADRADGFALRRAKPRAFSFFTDRARHRFSLEDKDDQAEYAARKEKQSRRKIGLWLVTG